MQFGWIGLTAQVAADRGVEIERMLLDGGVAARAGRIQAETWLDPAEYMLMCVTLINAVDDEMHGATRSRMRRGTAAMGGKLVGSARSLGEAINHLFRFYDLAGGFCDVRLRRVEGAAIIEIRAAEGSADLTCRVEELMATHLHALFSHFLGFPLPLQGFTTRAQDHPNLGGLHPYLRCRVVHGGVTSLVLSPTHLDLPPRSAAAGSSLFEAMHFWVDQLGQRQDGRSRPDPSAPVSAQVYDHLMAEDLDFAACCARLGANERETRQALFAEGQTFRELRRAALLARVRPHLDARLGTDDIAFVLGYSDGRSLRRAIKSASGMSLSEARLSASRGVPMVSEAVTRSMRRQMEQME